MIILNSLKILEQLSEIEQLIQKVENYIELNNLDIDREKVLEVIITSRSKNKTKTIN